MRSEQGGEERSELLIDVQQMSKIYNEGRENEVRALDNISLSVQWGEFLCILGQSGSGKSTLMNILGCLDIPTYGTYYLDGQPVSDALHADSLPCAALAAADCAEARPVEQIKHAVHGKRLRERAVHVAAEHGLLPVLRPEIQVCTGVDERA